MPYPVPRVHPIVQATLNELGADLRRRRGDAALTQRQLEELIGIDQTTISRIENGQISTLRLHQYARLLAAIDGRFGSIERRPRRERQRDGW